MKKNKSKKTDVEKASIPDYQTKIESNRVEDIVTQIAFDGLDISQQFKQPRMNQLIMYEALYNNYIPPRLRQMFNVPIPMFAGMIDTLLADFNDQIQIKFAAQNPAQYLYAPKIQAHWEAERDSLTPNAMWNYKVRTDRFNAALSGVGILKLWGENDPEYKQTLEVVNLADFHFQPLGGGILDNHLIKGQEGIYKTKHDLETNPEYDQDQVKMLTTKNRETVWQDLQNVYGTRFARFKSLGLDVETNAYTGTATYNMCEFIITYEGVEWYTLFDPITRIWVRCKPWKEVNPKAYCPWVAWHTHEDHKNFLSKSFADDLYYSAESIITMFNQELTNREKANFHARAFDKDMFTDVQKLDQAQFRPDALVPADTQGGTKRISEGIYEFKTAELQGTVSLIEFVSNFTGQNVGVSEVSMGGSPVAKKTSVVMQQAQQVSKRIGYRSDSFKEAYARLGYIFVENMKEFMPSKMSVKIIGENGFIEESEIKKIDLTRSGMYGISVSSGSEQEGMDNLRKEGRAKAIEMIIQNPNLTPWEKETILRDVGQFDEQEINFALQNLSFTSRKQIAHASEAIQDILLDREPDLYYGADDTYIQYVMNFIIDNKNKIKDKEGKFMTFMNAVAPIAHDNAERNAVKSAQSQPQPQDGGDQGNGKPPQPPVSPQGGGVIPSPVSMANKMGQMQ